jgi:DNA helicase-2/ATP-dependent DNA helicase PcrA
MDELESLEEERRLFYVAVTRAKDELYLTYPIVRFTRGEGASMMQESRFVGEIPKSLLEEWRLQMGYNPYGSYGGREDSGPF